MFEHVQFLTKWIAHFGEPAHVHCISSNAYEARIAKSTHTKHKHKRMPIAHAHGEIQEWKKKLTAKVTKKTIKIYAFSTCMTWSSLVLLLVLLLLLLLNIFAIEAKQLISFTL